MSRLVGIDIVGNKAELMVALGADHVVDYLKDDFTAVGARFDLIVDFVAHRSIFDYRRALAPRGRYVMVGGSVPRLLQTVTVGALLSCLGSRQMGLLLHEQRATDIETLLDLCRDGHLVPHIGHRFPLSQADEALRLLIAGGSMGKIVVDVVRD